MRAQVEAGRHAVLEDFEAHHAGRGCDVIEFVVDIMRPMLVGVTMAMVVPFAAQKPRAGDVYGDRKSVV